MNLILQNPYRVIGVYAGSSQRLIEKQKARINAFQRVGKNIEFPSDLGVLDNPDRSESAIKKAFSQTQINKDKVFHALFWFINANHLDDMALTYLQEGDIKKAGQIWRKATDGRAISQNNISAVNNLGTLYWLLYLTQKDSLGEKAFLKGFNQKVDLILSDAFIDFCHLVADETYSIDPDKELELVTNATLQAGSSEFGGETKLAVLLGSLHSKVKSLLSSNLTENAIHSIEQKVNNTKKKREATPKKGLQLAGLLYRDIDSDLQSIAEFLGKTDLKYKMVADKVAKEMLQCGIDCFMEYRDEEENFEGDLGRDVMNVFRLARNTAVGNSIKERIEENVNGLSEWIEEAGWRQKIKLVDHEIKSVTKKLKEFDRRSHTIENANELVISCTPYLENIKLGLGAENELFLQISGAVVNNAQAMLVSVVNRAQELPILGEESLNSLYLTISKALKVSERLGKLSMGSELRARYIKNHSTLKSIKTELDKVKRQISTSSPSASGGGGCYIATMAYGSYDHPQVMALRRFRDEKLSRTPLGRLSIRTYYRYSPTLVKVLRGKPLVNSIIRTLLNRLINRIQ
jgi:hypothetical protein